MHRTRLTHPLSCCIESWANSEIKAADLRTPSGFRGHRKEWEWLLGIVSMQRFDNTIAIGKERILFYLANKVKHVYATDLYEGKASWKEEAPSDLPENPSKLCTFSIQRALSNCL
jgi:hypothetical protein